jgi:hypothetical protein
MASFSLDAALLAQVPGVIGKWKNKGSFWDKIPPFDPAGEQWVLRC